jgi:hypothetical protein
VAIRDRRRGIRAGWRAAVGRALALVSAGALAACNQMPSYRYRMTVEVETPEGLKTGSSVIEVKTSGGGLDNSGGIASKVRGAAVAVDLGARGTLFALLSGHGERDRAAGIAPTALIPDRPDRRGTAEAWANNLRAMKMRRNPAELPASYYPTMVRFRSIDDPKTVQDVDPANLAASFGPGVELDKITVQLTDDSVTFGISNRFSWWKKYKGLQLDGNALNNFSSTANNLNRYDFQRGD